MSNGMRGLKTCFSKYVKPNYLTSTRAVIEFGAFDVVTAAIILFIQPRFWKFTVNNANSYTIIILAAVRLTPICGVISLLKTEP